MAYLEEARSRARRRRSPWNLLLVPAVLTPYVVLLVGTAATLSAFYRLRHPSASYAIFPDGIPGIVMAIGPLVGSLAPAMLIGNWMVRSIPTARRALDEEAEKVPGTTYRDAQRALLKISAFIALPAAAMSILAALL